MAAVEGWSKACLSLPQPLTQVSSVSRSSSTALQVPSFKFLRRLCACNISGTTNLEYGVNSRNDDTDKSEISGLTATEKASSNLHETSEKFAVGRVRRIRQHVNPLKASLMAPVKPPNWQDIFDDASLPLMVDIGCGSGNFLICLANRFVQSKNFLGLEIRKKLVERAENWVKNSTLSNIHFMVANATFSFGELIQTYPGPLVCVTILCPDPHFKRKHHKRRILQTPLVNAIIKHLEPGGQIFIQSDVLEVAQDMRQRLDECVDSLKHVNINLCDSDGWLLDNPFNLRTEREIHAQNQGAKIYWRLYEKL